MSDLGKNNDLPPETRSIGGDPHKEFQELCALSTTGELTMEDLNRLGQHLAECTTCAKLLKEYEELAKTLRPALASGFHAEANQEEALENPDRTWSIDQAEERLINALRENTEGQTQREFRPPKRSAGGVVLKIVVAASLFGASCLSFYHLGRLENRRSNQTGNPAPRIEGDFVPRSGASPLPRISDSTPQPIAASEEKRITALKEAIARGEKEKEGLKVRLNQFNEELTRSSSALTKTQNERSEFARELDQWKAKTESLEASASQADGAGN